MVADLTSVVDIGLGSPGENRHLICFSNSFEAKAFPFSFKVMSLPLSPRLGLGIPGWEARSEKKNPRVSAPKEGLPLGDVRTAGDYRAILTCPAWLACVASLYHTSSGDRPELKGLLACAPMGQDTPRSSAWSGWLPVSTWLFLVPLSRWTSNGPHSPALTALPPDL